MIPALSNARYELLLEQENKFDSEERMAEPYKTKKALVAWKLAVFFSMLLNVLLMAYIGLRRNPATAQRYEAITLIENPRNRSYAYRHFTNYSSPTGEDTPEIQALWKKVKSEHGSIAVDKKWAMEQNIAPALSLPSDASKGVYGIDAYHQMHCLIMLRTGFYNLYRNDPNPFSKPLHHYSHCFDHLRQSIMCEASDVLWATQFGGKTGDGQQRQCRDWTKLRDWATRHPICDEKDVHHMNDFLGEDICHGDRDGLRLLDE